MGSILRCSILLTERERTHICIVAIKDKNMGFIHIDWIYFVYIMLSSFLRYSVFITLDAFWIAVDGWSNSSRCMRESVYLSQT